MSQNNQAQQQPNTAVTTINERNISDQVMAKVNAFQASGEIMLPPNYSAANALKSAYLILQETKDRNEQPVLATCSKESIANALFKMVVWGLSPLKKQCDFIAYGTQLVCSPEYTGNIALAKRYGKLKDYKARAIFKGDVFEFEVDAEFPYRTRIVKHEQKLENVGGEVVGAYFAFELESGEKDVEIMNINQIRKSWEQGAAKGKSGAHTNFSDQMAIKTVINRGCKLLIRASDDNVLFDDTEESAEKPAQTPVSQEANKTPLHFDDAVVVESKTNKAAAEPTAAKPATAAPAGQPIIANDEAGF